MLQNCKTIISFSRLRAREWPRKVFQFFTVMVVSSVASPAAAATFETNKQTKSVSGRKSGSVRPQNFFFSNLTSTKAEIFSHFFFGRMRFESLTNKHKIDFRVKNFLGSRRSGKNSDKLERLRALLTPAISEGTFMASPTGAGVQGGSAPLLGSWDTT